MLAASRRTTSRLTARRCSPTSARHRGHPQLSHRRTCGQAQRCEQCDTEMFSSTPVAIEVARSVTLPRPGAPCAAAVEMLVPHFHVTVTVPAELREVLRAHQRDGYAVLMRASAAAIIELARDPRYVGGTVAVLAVLHTWTQQLNLHPHVHRPGQRRRYIRGRHHLASGAWRNFLVPIKALDKLVRAVFRDLLRRKCPGSRHPGSRGVSAGSSTSPPGAMANRPCSILSPATSFASFH